MPQIDAWEKEYHDPKLVTGKAEPQNDVKRFIKYLKKVAKIPIASLRVLDLGCGTGRNTNYLAALGCKAIGYEISRTALAVAKKRAEEAKVKVHYEIHNIGEAYPLSDNAYDLVLDITSSNSLNEKERGIYLTETQRVLKPGGILFVRALCKDGDANVKALLTLSPGKERDTYINKEMGLVERVFSKEDFIKTYEKYFSIIKLEKKTGYARFNDRIYKRNYWLAYMKKV
jgi:SAM-dependent methyltransferase